MTNQEVTTNAIARAGNAADREWLDRAGAAMELLARERREFSADDVWERVAKPREPRALGAVFRRAAARGLISKTDRFIDSVNVSQHCAPVRVWRSNVAA
jgi:hypothetical protein